MIAPTLPCRDFEIIPATSSQVCCGDDVATLCVVTRALVLQGSVLGPILVNLYTTPLSTVIANTSLSHHLYAEDTQLFTLFVPKDFPFVITQLQSSVSTTFFSGWLPIFSASIHPRLSSCSLAYLSSYPEFTLLHFPFRLLNQFFLVHLHAIYTLSLTSL